MLVFCIHIQLVLVFYCSWKIYGWCLPSANINVVYLQFSLFMF